MESETTINRVASPRQIEQVIGYVLHNCIIRKGQKIGKNHARMPKHPRRPASESFLSFTAFSLDTFSCLSFSICHLCSSSALIAFLLIASSSTVHRPYLTADFTSSSTIRLSLGARDDEGKGFESFLIFFIFASTLEAILEPLIKRFLNSSSPSCSL